MDDLTILVVDGGSTDGTRQIVERLRDVELNTALHLLSSEVPQGLGAAYKQAFQWAAPREFSVVVGMDGDLQHDPSELRTLVRAVESGADLAVGSRYVSGGSTHGWSPARRRMSLGANRVVRRLLELSCLDATSGYRAYRMSLLSALGCGRSASTSFAFQVELAYRASVAGASVVEVPIAFRQREFGRSKLTPSIALRTVGRVALLALWHRTPSVRNARSSLSS